MGISLEQNIWDERELVKADLPDEWDVSRIDTLADNEPMLTKEEIWEKPERPYGMPSLSQMAIGKKKIRVASDDGGRGTSCGTAAEVVLEILLKAGIKKENTFFICAPSSYGIFGRKLFSNKLGEKIVSEYSALNHDCRKNCTSVGVLNGVDIKVNNEFLSCDLRIGIGGISPHTMSGLSGGSHLLISGLYHLDIMEGIYNVASDYCETAGNNFALLTGHEENMMMHEVISEMAEMVGDFFKIDCVCNSKMELVELLSGHVLTEYVKAAASGEKTMMIPTLEEPADIVIANNNAKTSYAVSDLITGLPYLKKGGILVLVNHTEDGQILHYLRGNWGENCQSRTPVGNGLDLSCRATYSPKHGDYNTQKTMHLEHNDYVWVKTWKDVISFITAEYESPRICALTEVSMGIV